MKSFKEKSSKNAQPPKSSTVMNQNDHNEPCDLRQRKVKTSDSSDKCSDNSKLSNLNTPPASIKLSPELSQRQNESENDMQENESQLCWEAGPKQSEPTKNDDDKPINKHAKCDALVIITVIISAILIKLMIDYLF